MNFKELLGGKKTAGDYQEAITQTKEHLNIALYDLELHQADRGRVLLEGSDADISKFETESREQRLNVERLGLALTELNKRQDEAAEKEQTAARDREFTRAKKAQERGVKVIEEYQHHATAIAMLLRELSAANDLVNDVNASLAEAGDERRVKTASHVCADGRAFTELTETVSLPGKTFDADDRIWPPAVHEMNESRAVGREVLESAIG